MITNTGKGILAKYLIGQAPAYASYIALGCGPKPLSTSDDLDTNSYAQKTSLDFEMFRIPITSRGYVTDVVNDVEISKVVLTAELPPEQRYEVSEIGVYSAKSNPSATAGDSRILYTFTESENWEYHQETSSDAIGTAISAPLDGVDGSGSIVQAGVFRATNDNVLFSTPERKNRYEGCRFLNSSIFMPGDMSNLINTDGVLSVDTSDELYKRHIHAEGVTVDLGKNSPEDELRLAFSVVSKDPSTVTSPTETRILVEFANNETASAEYARFQVIVTGAELSASRYHISKSKLSELIKSSGFSWGSVSVIKIYAFVVTDGAPGDYYVALDALRFENTSTQNPVYGLSGYSPVMTSDAMPFIKNANTSNLIEFRFGLDVS